MREKGFKLDGFKWLKEESADDPDELPEPEDLAADALADLKAAKAFRGELVPTEAEHARRENRPYESATELLARVRTSAATHTAKPMRPRKPKGNPTP